MTNAMMRFAKSTAATESGFIAAGLTVSIVAIMVLLSNWIM